MECGSCTLCCTLLPVKELDKPKNTSCVHCDVGCKIWSTKPRDCTDFRCAYHQANKANVAMRPDNSGVIFEKLSDMIMWGTCKPRYKYKEMVYGQIHSFQNEGYTVVMKEANDNKPTVFFAKGQSREDIEQELSRLEGERIGYSNIHN